MSKGEITRSLSNVSAGQQVLSMTERLDRLREAEESVARSLAMLDQVAATLPAKFEHQAELFGKRLEPLAQSMAKLTDETRRTMWTAQRDLAQWRQARMKEVADWNVRKATWAKEHAALMSQLRGTAVQLRRDQAKSLFQQMLIGSLVGAASGLAALVIGWSLLRAAGRI